MIIGVCAGAKVVAAAGLLTDKRATTHWYFLAELRKKHPAIHYVADRRRVEQLLPPIECPNPATVLDEALRAIAARYGAHTADFVAMQLEYPKGTPRVASSGRSGEKQLQDETPR